MAFQLSEVEQKQSSALEAVSFLKFGQTRKSTEKINKNKKLKIKNQGAQGQTEERYFLTDGEGRGDKNLPETSISSPSFLQDKEFPDL